jgi:dTDP-4-dehydrorhamnose reductase
LQNRVLILGSTGLIGHQVHNYLKSNGGYELHNIAYRNKLQKNTILIDARDENNLIEQIASIKPQYIVNCIGILIGGSNKDPENSVFLNAYMPHRLARLADEIDAKLIHISTDCVFSGDKKESYIETDEKDGRGVYAKSKGLGEIVNNKHLTLRTSVVGPELKTDGEELFHWFMNQQGDISGFTKAIWSGITTIELAKAVKWSIDNDITGLYHVTNNSSISKYSLLQLFQKYTKKDISIKPINGKDVDKSFIDTRLLMDYEIPSYDQMISDMVDLITNNRTLYSQYKVGSFDKE